MSVRGAPALRQPLLRQAGARWRRRAAWAASYVALLLGSGIAPGRAAMPAGEGHGIGRIEMLADIEYARPGGRALHVDLHRNLVARPSPVLVHVHGGGWSRGARPPREAFAWAYAMGFSVVAVEYRLAGEAHAPAAVRDVRCALAWVGRHAARHGLDASRIVVEGVSAGAHLALLAVLAGDDAEFDAGCGPVPPVAVLVDRAGIADVQAWRPASGAVARWIGPRADAVDYAARLSPIRYLHRAMPPLFIVHGDADPVVPFAQSRRLHDAVRALGVPVALHVVAGGRHGGFTDAQAAAIDAALCLFLRGHGVPACDGRPARSPDPGKGGDP
ncbi:alpha/beta hydrolase fold domain-containing protein [Luteimonas salinilitoris]|uniref:Alpha/beta hydrolase fold domain-containing protein n=1 Tax=Luteimonas salinilitoris TaxID=3237697 RepID=A0ABV4HMF5_9GAMM